MSADLDRIGTVIDGKYELQRLIGRGGMGAVYAARQSQLDRQVRTPSASTTSAQRRTAAPSS